jgi:hypothetical protein
MTSPKRERNERDLSRIASFEFVNQLGTVGTADSIPHSGQRPALARRS